MTKNAVWVLTILTMAASANALQTNLPSLSDVAYCTPYDQQGGDVTQEVVTGDGGLILSSHNSTSDRWVNPYSVGTTLGDKIDGFDVGKFGNCFNGSVCWMNINMVNSQAPLIQRFAMSFWFKRDTALVSNYDSGMGYLWEVRDGWSLDEKQIDLEHNTNNTNVDYLQLQVDYKDGENKIRVFYNGGSGSQEFAVYETLEGGAWHNVIINFQGYYSSQSPYYQTGTDIDLYIDGVEIPSTGADFVANGWGSLRIEAFGFGNHYAKAGMGIWDDFDDFALWKRTLTPAEITWIASGAAPIGVAEPIFLSGGYPAGDFDNNGNVNQVDFETLINAWMGDCSIIYCGQTNNYFNDVFDLPNFAAFAQNWLSEQDTGPVLAIENHNGVPTFNVDGAFTTAAVFSHAQPTDTNPIKGFAEIGTIIQDLGAMDLASWWKGTNPYRSDYITFNRYLEVLMDPVAGDPDVILFPWINLVAPTWWTNDAANVNELESMDTGSGITNIDPDGKKNGSLASPKWRQDVKVALENYIDFLYLSGRMNNIGGFKIADTGCGGENLWRFAHTSTSLPGYGLRTKEAFRNWLKVRYNNDVAALRTAWSSTTVTFDNAEVPTKANRMLYSGSRTFRTVTASNVGLSVVDFELFYNDLVVETMDYFAGVIKNKTNYTKLVGGFYCYMYEWCGNPMDGHQALTKYNDSENLDFVWQTASYQNRLYQTGADLQRGPAYSSQLHGKQWMNSNDTATKLAAAEFQPGGSQYSNYAYTETVEKNKRMFLRSAGYNICNNGILQEYFSLHDGWYDNNIDPGVLAAAGQVNQIYINSKNHDRSTNAEVLIVTDEVSCSYTTYTAGDSQFLASVLRNPQIALAQMGTPADHILVDDIDLLPNSAQYKLVVFMNCWHLSDAQRTLINSLKGNNRTLVFCYAPGYFNGNSVSTANMQSLTGMTFTVGAETYITPKVYVKAGHALANAIRNAGTTSFGPSSSICRRIYVNDSSATLLGSESSTANSYKYMAIKNMGSWQSVYSITPQMTAAAFREIARYADVHIYNNSNDTFYANSSYVCIHPNHSESVQQSRTITFPFAVNLYDAETETLIQSNISSYTRLYGGGETKVYRYAPAQ